MTAMSVSQDSGTRNDVAVEELLDGGDLDHGGVALASREWELPVM